MPQVDFVNHHVHSHFSTLDGLSSPQEIVQRIVDLGQKSVSVTDHGSMSAIPSMYKAAKDAGIGFTPGCEMYFATDRTYKAPDKIGEKYYHLILLANSNEGYRNLLKMQTVAWEDGYYYKPRIDYDVLDKYHKGITVTTSCLGGIVNQYLLRGDVKSAEREVSTLIDIFGKDNVYVELQNHGIKDQLKILGDQRDLAQRFDLKMIATTDSHYCTEDESDIHDSLLCTGTRAKKNDEKRFRFESDQNFLQSGKKMLELFPEEDFPGAISNTVELAEKTEFSMNMGDNKKYLMPAGHYGEKSDVEVLRERVYAGAQDMKRYGDENGDIPEEVSKRIDYELSVIEKMQFSSYFLIMENIISLLARNGIHTGPGRGCVTAGTVVKTSAGEKSIEDMTIGDKVLTHTGEIKKVLNTMEYETGEGEELVRISATHSGSTSYVTTTQKHLVYAVPSENALGLKSGLYVPGKIGYQTPQWIPSSHIKVGDFIAEPVEFLSCGYVYRKVSDIEKVSDVEKVYDITVEDDNSYVTSIGAIHNSAPGSVVVYCLGIVDVDPLEHGLLFERFLNPDRISMPDIDVDIPKSKRQKALELVEEEYGKGHVAHLSNYSKMGMRDSLLRAAKVYGLSPSDANKFRDEIATWCEDYGESLVDFAKRGKAPKEIEKKIISTPHYNSIVKTAAKFIGRIMSYGVHASGILITDTPLDDNFPLRKSDKTQLPVCQFDGTDTESIGGVKFDLLGLINLDECEDTERNILLDLGEEVDSSDLAYDDEEVYNMLSHGNGGGVFQLGCVTGDTIVDGQRIDMMYSLRNSDLSTKEARSLFFGKGNIGNHCVDKVVFSGVKDTIKVSTSHHSITCTPEHHIWTKQGWVKAGDLTNDDYILTVKDDFTYASGVRGLEDIIDLYLTLNPGWERYQGKNPVKVDGLTYYPHVINDKWDRYVCFYPDEAYRTGVKAEEKAQARNDNGDKIVTIMSYGQMVETYVHENKSHDHIISPVGTTWEKVESIEDNGKEKTYDLMMDYPVNNFIANGIVTHNSSGIQSLLRHMQPSEFKHIPAILALYRPGPMGMGTHDEYCERRLGQHESVAMHHDMEEVLGENYNLIIYQEDIMHIARLMAGYTGGEADDLRKAMAKKDPQKMEKHKKKFIPEVNKRYGGKLGNELWDVIEPFGAYAFNRCAHGRTKVVSPEHGSIRIQDLYEMDFHGMEILSMDFDGKIKPHRINKVVKTGRKPVYTIKTEKGRTIMITKEHRMLTTGGYGSIEDGSICIGAELFSDDNPDGGRKYYISENDRKRRKEGAVIAGRTPKSREAARQRMTDYQSTLTFEDRSKHQKRVSEMNPHRADSLIKAQERVRDLWENSPEWVEKQMEAINKAHEDLELRVKNGEVIRRGLGHLTVMSNGEVADSITEAKVGEHLIQLGFEDLGTHKRILDKDGNPTTKFCDFYINGMYIEVDGLKRGRQYFIDNKYGNDIPFVYVTPYDYVDVIDSSLMSPHVENGDRIIEIIPPRISKSGKQYTEMTYDIEMMPDGPSNFIANGLVSHNSHSVAYGMITYRTAWLKAHYPAQFSGAVIDQRMSNPDDVFETVSWIKREGIGVYAPDVQRSEMRSVTTSDSIYLPLHIIKGMGAKKAEEIIDERNANGPFKTVVDFAARCKLSKSMIINMAKAGAFDSMGANRAAVISKAEEIIDASKSHKSVMDLKQGLFGSMISSSHKGHEVDVSEDPIIITVDGEDIEVDDTIRSQWERDIMGVLIGTHPFETLRDEPYFQNMFTIYPPIDEYTQSSRNAQFCGYIYNISNRVSGKGNPYCSFMIETDRASVPALRFKEPIDESHEGAFIKVEGSIENDANGEGEDFTPKAICNKIIKVDVKKRLNNDKE